MPGDVSFKFTGGKELERAMTRLDPLIERKLGRQALRFGAKVYQKDIASKLPESDLEFTHFKGKKVPKTHLKKSVRVARIRGTKDLVIRIGVTGLARFYAHIIEFGNSEIQAQPVWRPSFRRMAQKVVATVAAKLGSDIIKEVRKGN